MDKDLKRLLLLIDTILIEEIQTQTERLIIESRSVDNPLFARAPNVLILKRLRQGIPRMFKEIVADLSTELDSPDDSTLH